MTALQDQLAQKLDIDERLLNFGALTVGQVVQDLTDALDFVTTAPPANSDEELVKQIVVAELHQELEVAERQDQEAPEDLEQWPRQRRAIERAYGFETRNQIDLDTNAQTSQAEADAVNNVVDKAGDAVKDAGKGLFEGLAGVIVLVLVVLVISQLGGRRG